MHFYAMHPLGYIKLFICTVFNAGTSLSEFYSQCSCPVSCLLQALHSFFFFFPISAVNDGSSDHKRLLLAALEKGFIGCAFFFLSTDKR